MTTINQLVDSKKRLL